MSPAAAGALAMESVACRSIPRADGNGADGCGKGWTQVDGATRICPTCRRPLIVTGRWRQVELRRAS